MNPFKKIRSIYRTLSLLSESHQTHINLPRLKSIDAMYQKYKLLKPTANTQSLDLGCGVKPRNPFNAELSFGLDVRDDLALGIKSADLVLGPIPFEDQSFDFVTAYDFLEHVPRVIYLPERRFSFIQLMNEIHRTLKPGGIFLSRTPFYPISSAFTDPTHVNVITADTFPMYFDDKHAWAKMYGFKGSFKLKLQAVNNTHLLTILQKS